MRVFGPWLLTSLLATVLAGASACDNGSTATATPAPSPVSALETVRNRILASHGVVIEREPDGPQSSATDAPADSIKEILRQVSLPSEFAEPPRLVHFNSRFPESRYPTAGRCGRFRSRETSNSAADLADSCGIPRARAPISWRSSAMTMAKRRWSTRSAVNWC